MIKNIYFTIFAGRQRYLSILKNYLDYCLDNKIITEVHLWDFCRDPNDSIYIKKISEFDCRYKLFLTNHQKSKELYHYSEYYNYYHKQDYQDTDIIIKCDDDIVYIDIDNISNFIDTIKDNSLYFPNIVNNDVCAYLQSKHGIHNFLPNINQDLSTIGCKVPLTEWYKNKNLAIEIHDLFLQNPENFKLKGIDNIYWGSRISINMFAGNFKTIKSHFKSFEDLQKQDDEIFLGAEICVNNLNTIVPYFTVVHFSFKIQHTVQLDEQFLPKYLILSNLKIQKQN